MYFSEWRKILQEKLKKIKKNKPKPVDSDSRDFEHYPMELV